MKTKIISITSAALTTVLKTCQSNNIKCNYLGIRETNEVLIEIIYDESKDALICQLMDYINDAAIGAEEMTEVINQMIDKSTGNQKEALKEFFSSIKIQLLEPFKFSSNGRARK
jgi:hypothetical protein